MASPQPEKVGSESSNQVPFHDAATALASSEEPSDSHSTKHASLSSAADGGEKDAIHFEPLKPARTTESKANTNDGMTEEELFKTLSKTRSRLTDMTEEEAREEQQEIERLMSRMFGKSRQEQSDEEKTRHVGVVWKDLTVKGVGLGASLQPTNGDIFMGIPRFFKTLLTSGAKAASGKPPVRDLLTNFTGCIRPGEMALVLGRPGSGCSTFLKVLGNQRSGYVDVEGHVTYGGTDSAIMAKQYRGEIIYNPEDDLHYATLTVKDTLSFAIKTRTPGKASRNAGESRKDYVREFLRVVTKLFWIEHTLGTKVGDAFVRGVSGGEKKRVSIAEAMVAKASVQAWDNSTRGLDASTALEYVQSIRTLTNMAHVSTAVALYQAGESLFRSFDKVLLIDEGQCLYYGAADEAKQYFTDLGFVCRDRWTTADFLTSVSDPHERSIREGWEDRVPRSAEQFADAYIKSEAYQKNLRDIQGLEAQFEEQRKEREGSMVKETKEKNYTIPFHKQVLACAARQVLVVWGDKASLMGKWGGIIFQALIVGSLFYNQPKSSQGVFTRGGVIFFMLFSNALLGLAELTASFGARPVMLKHKSFSFYRPAAFGIAQILVDVPLNLIQVLLLGTIMYFMSDLARTASQYFINMLFLWICTMSLYAFFRALAALSGTLDVATRFTGVAIQILVVYTGYLIPPGKQHPWFHWLSYINPLRYGYEALMANEFYNLDLECVSPNLVPQGPGASSKYQSCTTQGSEPGQIIVNGANYIQVAYGYTRAHLWRNFGILCGFFIAFVVLTMIGMERTDPNKGGGAVTVFKRGQVPKHVEESIATGGRNGKDEESGEKRVTPAQSDEDLEPKQSAGVARNETIFTYQNVNYTIPYEGGQRQLLCDVQGYVRPGKLTALMGASGAGKTTLLNTLAQRITFGVVEGDFLVDGRPLPKSFQRGTGFAEQMDVHEPTSTVREALRFSALLRQPKEVPMEEKFAYCEKVIDLLEMRDIAGATIGQIGNGLNQEQRKRVTIGVELASKPELLMFLDEPTSGLDSAAAFNIVRFLRKLADAGQAILCTIHQPSSVLFEHFDEVLLLKTGGRVVYHGSLGTDSRTLIDYFERNGAKKCPRTANPAEYMLDAIGAGNPDYKGPDWGDVWANSPEHQQRRQEIQQMIQERSHAEISQTLKDDREYAMPLSTQITTVVKRTFVAYWRNPQYISGKFLLHIVTGLFNGFTFYHIGFETIDFQSRLFSTFMTLTICPPLIQQLQPQFLALRDIFTSRERNSRIYSWAAFVTAAIVVEIPYSLVAGSIYYCCWWFASVGYHVSSFASGYTYLMLLVFELYYLGLGQAIASVSPNELLASLLVPVFFLFVVSFCGVVAPYASLPTFWRSWMYWATPFNYMLSGFLGVATHDLPVECSNSEFAKYYHPTGQTCESYTEAYIREAGGYVRTAANGLCEYCAYSTGDEFAASFNVKYSQKWRNFGVSIIFVIFNFVFVYIGSYIYLVGWRKWKNRKAQANRSGKSKDRQEKGGNSDAEKGLPGKE